MKKMFQFFVTSNHFWHLCGGFFVGLSTFHPLYAMHTAAVAASCLEFKDMRHGCEWDWVDWLLTFVGGGLASLLITVLRHF